MANGKTNGEIELFLSHQEHEWERAAQLMWLVYNLTLATRATFGAKIGNDEFKEIDDFNNWLDVPGSDLPAVEKRKQEDELIEQRKREAANNGEQGGDTGGQGIR